MAFSFIKLRKTSSKEEILTIKYINELGLNNYSVYISGENDNIRRVYIINNTYKNIRNDDDITHRMR